VISIKEERIMKDSREKELMKDSREKELMKDSLRNLTKK